MKILSRFIKRKRMSVKRGFEIRESDIKKELDKPEFYKINSYFSVSSTGDILKKMALNDAPEGTVVIAEEQSAGRGRQGRSFFSPKHSGIYMSILLRPSLNNISDTTAYPASPLPPVSSECAVSSETDTYFQSTASTQNTAFLQHTVSPQHTVFPQNTVLITTAAAVSVCEAIEKVTKINADIKWVNDIFCHNLKVSGILTEGTLTPGKNTYDFIMLGIGINVFSSRLPRELKGIAGSVFPFKISKKRAEIRAKLLAEILNRFEYYYRDGILAQNNELFVKEYKKRSLVTDKDVTVTRGNEVFDGRVLSVNNDCSLTVKLNNGETLNLFSGEVRIKLKN